MPDLRALHAADRKAAIDLLRAAETQVGAAVALLKWSHPATVRNLIRVRDRLNRHRHRLEDGEAS